MGDNIEFSKTFAIRKITDKVNKLRTRPDYDLALPASYAYEIKQIFGIVDLPELVKDYQIIDFKAPMEADAVLRFPIAEAGKIQRYEFLVTPQAANTSVRLLTLKTSAVGKETVVIPFCSSTDTLDSGKLTANIYVDDAGNVSGKQWSIKGLNANGTWEISGNRKLKEWGNTNITVDGPVSAPFTYYKLSAALTLPFPMAAGSSDTADGGATPIGFHGLAFANIYELTDTTIRLVVTSNAALSTPIRVSWHGIGEW